MSSYTAYAGRLPPLPSWTNKGAVLGLEGGTKVVMDTVAKIRASQGSLDDVAAVWLQDWTGQRRFNNSGHDIARVGLWWNWEVRWVFSIAVQPTARACASQRAVVVA